MAWTLFPEDAKQALRLKRFFMALLSYVLWISLTYYCYRLGLVAVSAEGFAWAVLGCAFFNLLFFWLLRSGRNLYWPDPSLTLPQMVVATFWVMLLMAMAPKVRGILLLLYVVVFLFGVFRLSRREYLALTALVLIGYGFVMLRDIYHHGNGEPWALEILQYVVLATTLVWLAFFGSYVGALRQTVSRRNVELGVAVARNRRLAIHDDLTGTYNRRHILQLLEQEQQRALRTGRGFCLCLMDLDHFKQINDRYGHLGGDAVLKEFAARVLREIRKVDWVGRDGALESADNQQNFGRYGGEEFLLVMPETGLDGALSCVERIRRKITEQGFALEQAEIRLTVSCGVAAWQQGEDTRAVLTRADQALYLAKEAGRDRVQSAVG